MRIRRSLIDLDDLTAEEIAQVFEQTAAFEQTAPGRRLAGKTCVNMFFEESTRTFTSFNMAELRLGADVVNLVPRRPEPHEQGRNAGRHRDYARRDGGLGLSRAPPGGGLSAAPRLRI